MKEARIVVAIILMLVGLGILAWTATKVGSHVRKEGLKPTIQRIWEGPK